MGRHVLLVALLLGSIARAEADTPKVAVVVQVRVNASEVEAKLLVGALENAISNEMRVAVLPQGRVASAVPNVAGDCLSRTSCVKSLLTKLGADDILSLVIVRIGDDFQIDTTWIDGKSGGLEARPQIRVAADVGDFVAAFRPYARKLLPHREPVAKPAMSKSRLAAWVLGGVGAAALATGTTLGIMAKVRFDDCTDSLCTRDEIDSIGGLELGADIGFAVALAAGGTALGLWLFGDATETPAIGMAPTGDSGATVFIGGRF